MLKLRRKGDAPATAAATQKPATGKPTDIASFFGRTAHKAEPTLPAAHGSQNGARTGALNGACDAAPAAHTAIETGAASASAPVTAAAPSDLHVVPLTSPTGAECAEHVTWLKSPTSIARRASAKRRERDAPDLEIHSIAHMLGSTDGEMTQKRRRSTRGSSESCPRMSPPSASPTDVGRSLVSRWLSCDTPATPLDTAAEMLPRTAADGRVEGRPGGGARRANPFLRRSDGSSSRKRSSAAIVCALSSLARASRKDECGESAPVAACSEESRAESEGDEFSHCGQPASARGSHASGLSGAQEDNASLSFPRERCVTSQSEKQEEGGAHGEGNGAALELGTRREDESEKHTGEGADDEFGGCDDLCAIDSAAFDAIVCGAATQAESDGDDMDCDFALLGSALDAFERSACPQPFDARLRYVVTSVVTQDSPCFPFRELVVGIAPEEPGKSLRRRESSARSPAADAAESAAAHSSPPLRLVLRGRWASMPAKAGDIVRVDGPTWGACACGVPTWVVDDEGGAVIVAPDCLVSGTRVAESFTCIRRSVLNERFRGPANSAAPAILNGSLLHEVFQRALAARDFSESALAAHCDAAVVRHLEDICCLGDSEAAVRERVMEAAGALRQWAEVFVRDSPSAAAAIAYDGASDAPVGGARRRICVRSMVDCEENYWSPRYGLKGKVDATVEMGIEEDSADSTLPKALGGAGVSGEKGVRTCVVPLELKTGRSGGAAAAAHRAQLILYTLLMAERHASSAGEGGLLFYLRGSEMSGVSATRAEIRELLAARNDLASYLAVEDVLPPMLQQEHSCRGCFQADTCAIYHRAVEAGNAETAKMGPAFAEHTAHLSDTHADYFRRWIRLIDLEAGEARGGRREIWTMSAAEREARGRCFARMAVASGPEVSGSSFLYTFRRDAAADDAALGDVGLSAGDPVVVGVDGGECALASGFLRDVRARVAIVSLDRRLPAPYRSENGSGASGAAPLFRIDRDDFSAGMGLVRSNVVGLLRRGADVRRRQLIVDLAPPAFADEEAAVAQLPPATVVGLNGDQVRAIGRMLAAEDYALVLGMPGTGKTTTIARAVRLLVESGQTVLVASYTHTAVDTILLKLLEENVPFARLGSADKVHPAVKPHTPEGAGPFQTAAALDGFYRSRPVVATTCLGISHPLFARRTFDVCIVDEASQITEPVCLGPLRLARRFVLVGDHNQLPPLVVNVRAREEGLAVSLFRRLYDAHPRAVAALEHQYRMNADILLLTNTLIYDHRLRCGTESVARASLELPVPSALPRTGAGGGWLADIADPARRVVFVDTDLVPAPESKFGDSVRNDIEAVLVGQLTAALVACGVAASSIGIISPYRAQLTAIRACLRSVRGAGGVEVHTVDKYQGRDKDCIIVSLVRANSAGNVGDLMKDWRRVNVAFTRAKRKLVVFGSMGTFRHDELFARFRILLEENRWVYQLPAGAQEVFAGFNTTQTTQATQGPSPRKADRAPGDGKRPRVFDGGPRAHLGPIAVNVLGGI